MPTRACTANDTRGLGNDKLLIGLIGVTSNEYSTPLGLFPFIPYTRVSFDTQQPVSNQRQIGALMLPSEGISML